MGKNIDWEEFDQGEIPAVRIKFETKGDHVAGAVTNVRITDFGGKGERTPELWIQRDDGTEVSVVAGQVMLQRALAGARPAVGDRIAIVYTGDGNSTRAGLSPPKLFDVKIVRAGAAQPNGAATVAELAPTSAGTEPTSAVTADSLI
jgi:hypothetical protein